MTPRIKNSLIDQFSAFVAILEPYIRLRKQQECLPQQIINF
ncbi:hypothetical protein FDUTEX481_05249 [Tolypothrix sp. PCC 7601]|nr:hypothetical protein FDUTEX481_05249 [Tolypothrix sp. PCC 7601]